MGRGFMSAKAAPANCQNSPSTATTKSRPLGEFGMIQSDLVRRIWQQNPYLHRQEVETIVHAIFDEITATLVRGDRVELRGFGAFSVKVRGPYTARNPKTGVLVAVPNRASPHFKTGKEMRERLIRQSKT